MKGAPSRESRRIRLTIKHILTEYRRQTTTLSRFKLNTVLDTSPNDGMTVRPVF